MRQLRDLFDRGVKCKAVYGGSLIDSDLEGFSLCQANFGRYVVRHFSPFDGWEYRLLKDPPAYFAYIAGPMRGYPQHNMPAFDAAAQVLQSQGFYTFNPADLDRQNGIGPDTPDSAVTSELLRGCMERDLVVITKCTHLVLLNGWEESSGVRPEAALADLLQQTFLVQGMAPDNFAPASRDAVMAVIGARYVSRFKAKYETD
jgi:hypothetical protein